MFNSINENDSNGIDSIIFGDNGKGKVAFATHKISFVRAMVGFAIDASKLGT